MISELVLTACPDYQVFLLACRPPLLGMDQYPFLVDSGVGNQAFMKRVPLFHPGSHGDIGDQQRLGFIDGSGRMADPEGMLAECLQVGSGIERTVGDIVGLVIEVEVRLYVSNGLKEDLLV